MGQPPPASVSIAAFLLALFLNVGLGPKVGSAADLASAAAVAQGGLAPARWAFSIWGIVYALFATGYVVWAKGGCSPPLPWALCAAWAANAAWLVASTSDRWTLSMGLLLLYLCAALAALPGLQPGSLHASGMVLLNCATVITCVWLVAAAMLNAQAVWPTAAPTLRAAAVPCVVLFAALLASQSSGLAANVPAFGTSLLAVTLWIAAATNTGSPSTEKGQSAP